MRLSTSASFAWQNELGEACARARAIGPTFVSIVAETGAGKTLAAARALHFLTGGKLRATFALGLRSLTAQLARSMLADAGFPEKDMVIAVGQPETVGLDAIAREYQEHFLEAEARYGSESSDGADLTGELEGTAADASWIESLCTMKEAQELFGKKSLSILTSPLVACTADHLVASVSLLRGGDSKLFLRLTSAELVLDEIDAYSANDLQAIAKLAFAAGMNGKCVVLMSATMSPQVQAGLYLAWKQGLAAFFALHQKPLQFATVFSSNSEKSVVLNSPADEQAESAWVDYVTAVSAVYAEKVKTQELRKLLLWELKASNVADAREELVEIATKLHADHCIVDPASQNRVSVGYLEFKTAKSAWQMAQYLASRPRGVGPLVKFVSYHSKMPRSFLGVLDATLGQLTNRKTPDAFLQTPSLRAVLDEQREEDVIVIVCTTTLIETGRDFDFDWCVLEPRSVRGTIQAAGRVRRHRREGIVAHPNVVMLSTTLNSLELPDRSQWTHPGIEDTIPKLKVGYRVSELLVTKLAPASTGSATRRLRAPRAAISGSVKLAVEALPVAQWQVALDAQLCLLPATNYEQNRIGFMEHAVQGLNLKKTDTWATGSGLPPSAGFYLNSWAPFNAVHALETEFRGDKEARFLFIPTEKGVFYWDDEAKVQRKAPYIELSKVPGVNALIPDLEKQAARLPGSSEHIRGCSLRCASTAGDTKAATWDPILGFYE